MFLRAQNTIAGGVVANASGRFAAGENAGFFAAAIENTSELVVPTLSLCEVFTRILRQWTEDDALQAVAVMQQGTVVDLDSRIALQAARISGDLKLPLADSVMLATAREHDSTLWTQDPHFDGIPGVK